jgi:hypothetical protein
MTCKDCVHYEACKDMYSGYSLDFDDCDFTLDCIDMGIFKNKADFVEVKHGRWERCIDWEYDFCCSECGDFATLGEYNNHDVLTDFCPNCGADMRKGENNAK